MIPGLFRVLVDEADSLLIDEAVTPLIISNSPDDEANASLYRAANELAAKLVEGKDFKIDWTVRNCEPRLKSNPVLERHIQYLLTRPVGRPPKNPIVRYHEFLYQAASWDKARRFVAKVEWHLGTVTMTRRSPQNGPRRDTPEGCHAPSTKNEPERPPWNPRRASFVGPEDRKYLENGVGPTGGSAVQWRNTARQGQMGNVGSRVFGS
jgi:hypothetical protein